jgi:7-cyano-7-deazaguanine synthase in queuosine biosynthesis
MEAKMDELDYTYIFDDIGDISRQVSVIDHRENKQFAISVAVDDYQLLCQSRVPAEIADLVDLAVTIHVADRMSIRQEDFPCRIHVVLPVRYPEMFEQAHIIKCLRDVLYWYTGDYWVFEFKRRSTYGRRVELQNCISLTNDDSESVEVALWSGGLDSLAGLSKRLLSNSATNYTLFGTGSNTIIHHVQRQIARTIRERIPGRTKLIQVPIEPDETANLPKNSSQRSRGFIFLLLGAVCARAEGQNTLHVYENGIGAINLPFRASEVGLDHARSVHPLSLLRMSELVSQLLDLSFTFNNPFLFWTKAQMCESLIQANSIDLIFDTITCDHLHREKPMQCGLCSSCLLRRQALAVLGVADKTRYVSTHGTRPRMLDSTHLQAMLYQVNRLKSILKEVDSWRGLSRRYPQLSDIVDQTAAQHAITPEQMKVQLLQLYGRYVREWESVQHLVGRECLDCQKNGQLSDVTNNYQQEQIAWS